MKYGLRLDGIAAGEILDQCDFESIARRRLLSSATDSLIKRFNAVAQSQNLTSPPKNPCTKNHDGEAGVVGDEARAYASIMQAYADPADPVPEAKNQR